MDELESHIIWRQPKQSYGKFLSLDQWISHHQLMNDMFEKSSTYDLFEKKKKKKFKLSIFKKNSTNIVLVNRLWLKYLCNLSFILFYI